MVSMLQRWTRAIYLNSTEQSQEQLTLFQNCDEMSVEKTLQYWEIFFENLEFRFCSRGQRVGGTRI